jgi:hypothetical protein
MDEIINIHTQVVTDLQTSFNKAVVKLSRYQDLFPLLLPVAV